MAAHPVMIRPVVAEADHRPDMFSPCLCTTKYMVPLDRIDPLAGRIPAQQQLVVPQAKLAAPVVNGTRASSGLLRAEY
jgi:hypothetical protein